eukprot:jgi/Undpi1/3681/HiC_scaffold_16.g07051.m1
MERSAQLGRGMATAGTGAGASGPVSKELPACNKAKTAVGKSSQERGGGGSGGGSYGQPSKRHGHLAAMEDGGGVGGDPKKKTHAGVRAGGGGEPDGHGTSRGGKASDSTKAACRHALSVVSAHDRS